MQYDTLANEDVVNATMSALRERNIEPMMVANRIEALEKVKSLIPGGVSVMNGSSRTLEEIGFVEYLKSGSHGWNNLHAAVLAEQDLAKQELLRKQSVLSDYYVGSVHAISGTGELVFASNTGSQLPHLVFTSPNIVLVAGTQKITPTLADAMARLHDYVFPLEDQRMKEAGYGGSGISKTLIFNRENPMMKRKVTLILVNEKLGF